jgi:hypothetical protein
MGMNTVYLMVQSTVRLEWRPNLHTGCVKPLLHRSATKLRWMHRMLPGELTVRNSPLRTGPS